MSRSAVRMNRAELRRRRHDQEEARAHHRTTALFALDAPCTCGHPYGLHTFVTSALPSPCGTADCRCPNFQEPPMLNPLDPFAGLADPDAPPTPLAGLDEPDAPPEPEPIGAIAARVLPGLVVPTAADDWQSLPRATVDQLAGISLPVGMMPESEAVTIVRFPVVGTPPAVDFAALEEPARRVAEIVEAIEPVLVPPPVVRDLELLVLKANALEVTDAASYAAGCELYELLHANERGIEDSIGPVVSFFHRPWKALCDFRGRYQGPLSAAKKRLSNVCGAWKQAEDRRAKAEAQRRADEEAAAERKRLEAIAAEAATKKQPEIAEAATQLAAEVKPVVGDVVTFAPKTKSNNRTEWVVEDDIDEQLFYQAIADGIIPRVAAPIDRGYLKRQAQDLKADMPKRFPGVRVREKGGLSAGGSKR